MSDDPVTVATIRRLTEAQKYVLGLIAIGDDGGHSRQTLRSLEAKGLIESYDQALGGHPPLVIKRYQVPLPVHIAWCAWCSETVKASPDIAWIEEEE